MKTYFNWSSGKDASLALEFLQNDNNIKVEKLITAANKIYKRVSMHGVRVELAEKQSQAIGIPLEIIELPENPTMEEYEKIFLSKLNRYKKDGFERCVFGDIFLKDLRAYREKQLEKVGIKAIFPLWGKDTSELMREFIKSGFKAIVVCIDASKLDKSFLGREINESFIADLPNNVDLCGENGEFHTFCYDGPIFKYPVLFKKGEATFRKYEIKNNDPSLSEDKKSFGFWFLDLLPIPNIKNKKSPRQMPEG
ncbi:MAG: ATP-binding protein [Candidatus Cloacimonadota bacterium]|nr:MAG: ATP-binding protein [Candidatus Cloacimonadota bacterium]